MITILHSPYDRMSSSFVLSNPGYPVVNWYDDASRQAWIDGGGTNQLSAFPSVVFDHEEYNEITDGVTFTIPAGQVVVRLPETMDDALLVKAGIDARVLVTQAETIGVPMIITLAKAAITAYEAYGIDCTGLWDRIGVLDYGFEPAYSIIKGDGIDTEYIQIYTYGSPQAVLVNGVETTVYFEGGVGSVGVRSDTAGVTFEVTGKSGNLATKKSIITVIA